MRISGLLSHLLQPEAKRPEPDTSSSPVLALVDFLESIVISANQNSPLLKDLAQFRKFEVDEQEKELPALYLVIEQYIAEIESHTRYNRNRLRAEIRTKFPETLKLQRFGLIFAPDDRQRVILCRDFLISVLERIYDLLGNTQDQTIEVTIDWLRKLPDVVASPLPFGLSSEKSDSEFSIHATFSQLRHKIENLLLTTLGDAAAERIFQRTYKEYAAQFIGLDTFPALVGLMPHRLLDAEKIRLLSHDQVQQVLFNKIESTENLNQELAERNRQLEDAQVELKTINNQLIESKQELEAAQQSLVQQERLATLGQLTATVSHELRNPLGAIRTSIFLVKKKTEGKDLGVERPLDRVERNIIRCDDIIRDLLGFASEPTTNFVEIEADKWLRATLMEQSPPAGIEVITDFGAPSVNSFMDAEQIRRVIVNIYENSIQALSDNIAGSERKLTIRTASEHNQYKIIFEDTGPGIDAETLEKIFEPLFSTKSYGCGLGLPTVKKIIDKHEGSIHYNSKIGVGTTVTISLPLNPALERVA